MRKWNLLETVANVSIVIACAAVTVGLVVRIVADRRP
jgi:hypothetical protein